MLYLKYNMVLKKTVNVFEHIYSKKTVFQVNSGNFPEFFKIFQKCIIIMQSGPFIIYKLS